MYNFTVKSENDADFERLSETFARHALDYDDLQHEIAGRDVGGTERFLSGTEMDAGATEKRRATRAETLTRLQILLANHDYAAQYRMTVNHLNTAQDRLDKLLDQVRQDIELAEQALEDKRGRAARLEDGTRVYRDKDGNARTEDGEAVPDDIAAGVVWTGDEPTYDSIREERERLNRLKGLEDDVHAGQNRIGEIQDDLQNEDSPKTADDMGDLRKEADGIVSGVEARLDAEAARSLEKPKQVAAEPVSEVSVPQL